jgi:hypothetical protein
MSTLDLARLRLTVEFAKKQGWIKDPPPRKPGEACIGKTGRHHFKAGICNLCGTQKPDETERAKRYNAES